MSDSIIIGDSKTVLVANLRHHLKAIASTTIGEIKIFLSVL